MCHLFAHQPQRDYESQTRSLRMGGHSTSIRLEMSFWDTLEEIAAKEGMSLAKFLTTIDHLSNGRVECGLARRRSQGLRHHRRRCAAAPRRPADREQRGNLRPHAVGA